ncbi:DeoR family transcriptional regulator [Bifidobacterium tissieri]|uniref:DeoR family transcriptional regulator n=1 Tax=Bifidobacterium tissieri TaxID=1630162 RepID=A0A261FDC1_9BIFI|nr:diacylglycerol kinase family protein [Bifidobacterium tissieri]OZG57151.1 DeoR family transcriptional regulator [Bifidobacterium tissieri]
MLSSLSPLWIALIVIVVVAVIGVVVFFAVQAYRKHRLATAIVQRDKAPVHYAFILNPSKPGAEEVKQQILEFFESHHLAEPMIVETQLDKDGRDCAREAMARGADAIVAVGGDGTVRTSASAVAGTDRPFGIVPIGTGNLFARNMGIPLGDVEAALTVATSHGSRKVDMGRMALLDSDEPERKHAFLIIAGIGFDAAMIDDTDPALKKNISWLAYFVGGVKNLFTPHYHGDVTIIGTDGKEQTSKNISFRTFMAGNCGQIPGFSLMPEASYDDGILDFELIDTTGGLIGWANLFGDVVHQTIMGKPGQNPLSTNSSVDQIQGVRARIRLEKPALAEVDGDILGKTSLIEFSVQHRALCVRVPEVPATVSDATGVIAPVNVPESKDGKAENSANAENTDPSKTEHKDGKDDAGDHADKQSAQHQSAD